MALTAVERFLFFSSWFFAPAGCASASASAAASASASASASALRLRVADPPGSRGQRWWRPRSLTRSFARAPCSESKSQSQWKSKSKSDSSLRPFSAICAKSKSKSKADATSTHIAVVHRDLAVQDCGGLAAVGDLQMPEAVTSWVTVLVFCG